jgi:hypothetical protein
MYQFNAIQSATGRVKGFEAEHRPDDPFDCLMVLLDEIVQVLALADFDGLAGCLLERLKGGSVGPALVDSHFERKALLPNRFPENAQSGLFIAAGGEQVPV